MKKTLMALVPVLAISGCAGLGLGGAETLTGEIDSIDRHDRLVTIDGERYQIESVQVSDLDEGDKVTITVEDKVTITVEDDDPYDLITDID